MNTHAETLASLRAGGHRITPQRQIELEIVETSGEHLDAEAIHQRVAQKTPASAWPRFIARCVSSKRWG